MVRGYHSPGRQARAEATRRRIVEAAVGLLGEGGLEVPAVAAAASVSVPTVYRYFPDREALLDAVHTHLRERLGPGVRPATLEDVASAAVTRIDGFERNEAVVRAALATPGFLEALQRSRDAHAARLLAPRTRHLDAEDARAVRALLLQLSDAPTWLALKDEHGVAPEAIGRVVGWAISALLDRLREDGGT